MVLNSIRLRRSVRSFKPDPVNEDDLQQILRAGQFAPSAMNRRPVEFIVVKDAATRETIFSIVGQEYVKQAPVLIIPCVDSKLSVCPVQDISVATENIFIQAAELGLGTVWKNLQPPQADKLKLLLSIPDSVNLINLLPVGHPQEPVQPHSEAEYQAAKIHHEKW